MVSNLSSRNCEYCRKRFHVMIILWVLQIQCATHEKLITKLINCTDKAYLVYSQTVLILLRRVLMVLTGRIYYTHIAYLSYSQSVISFRPRIAGLNEHVKTLGVCACRPGERSGRASFITRPIKLIVCWLQHPTNVRQFEVTAIREINCVEIGVNDTILHSCNMETHSLSPALI